MGGLVAEAMWWSETDNRAISVQLNLTGTATGTELGKNNYFKQKKDILPQQSSVNN